MTPRQFCQAAMAEYEQQWSAAPGHQMRHPLKLKMTALEQLRNETDDPDTFGRLLAEGCRSDDPGRMLLCAELYPRWQAADH
jgi:hypothetical protein